MRIDTPLSAVSGIGYSFLNKLHRLELFNVADFLQHYPFRYDDFSNVSNLIEVKVDEKVTLVGEIWSIKNIYTKTGKLMTQAVFNDGTSPIYLTWFNQPWLIKNLHPGNRIQISGKVSKYKSRLSIISPVWEKVLENRGGEKKEERIHTGRIVPIYSETFGLTSKWIRAKMDQILKEVKDLVVDPLPDEIRGEMLRLAEALEKIHFPKGWDDVNKASKRLAFDELFFIQLATIKARHNWQKKEVIEPLEVELEKLEEYIKSLPFELTSAQKKVVYEICDDLKRQHPMNRLVQGEVGSGKTVVATVIMYLTYLNGLKSYLMAPTEILAFQHYQTAAKLLEPFGIKVGIYTGSKKFTKDKSFAKKQPDVVIGTHALISDKLNLDKVGLIIVDEQQRFGVEQRTKLRNKAVVPHFLTMTATPIPRTVALTLYGDLDLSIIDELPRGRKLVKTHVVPNIKREAAYRFIENKVKKGDQIYIITPLIEESETLLTAKAAKVEYERLSKKIFPKLNLGLLHGKMKGEEKSLVLTDFKDRKIDILVSTSVVEVGVDVPNATIMVIEGAERFGLAQLHQLRGRVGRGDKESFCFLFTETDDSGAVTRLKNLENIYSGLKLAELDLKIRGSGELFGIKQSGRWDLKIASLTDLELVEKTKRAAEKILRDNPSLDKYPLLAAKLDELTKQVMPD